MATAITPQDALIVVDMQNDFMPGGALAVKDGDQIVPLVNRLLERFKIRVFTRDWHPADHISFASKPAFTDKSWPAHCVQNTPGAEFHHDLKQNLADKIVSKGTDSRQEAYSGFQDTDLAEWLKQKDIRRVFVVGLATDYCVKSTALDAKQAGFTTYVIRDATRGVDNPPGNEEAEIQLMKNTGIHIILSQELLET